MSKDHLKKPVHVAILRATPIGRLKAAQGHSYADKLPPEPVPATKPHHPMVSYQAAAASASASRNQAMVRTKLRIWHSNAPKIPEAEKPPCDSCKTAACCHAFLVNITKEEYESGLYGDSAVSITQEEAKAFVGKMVTLSQLHAPGIQEARDQYYLEGVMGEPCPFLTKDAKCGIYERRPMTCRIYSCVGDSRITEEMRQGEVNIEDAIWDSRLGAVKT